MSGRVVKTSIASERGLEADPRAGRAADPVALHQLQRVRPVQPVQVGQQPVGVGGDPHHPLLERAPEHGEVAPLGAPVGGDLLVGQHRAQAGAPVDRRLVQVGQPVRVDDDLLLALVQLRPRPARRVGAGGGLAGAGVQLGDQLLDRPGPVRVLVEPGAEDLQEDPLGPLVVARVDRGEGAPLVVVDAQPPQLGADRGDVGLGGDPRVLPGLHGVLLGGQAEGVVAHGVQHVVAVHPAEPAGDVGAQVAQRVADVQPRARGVREHVHREELRPVGDPLEALAQPPGRVGRVERALGLPAVLPGELDLLGQRGRVAVRGTSPPAPFAVGCSTPVWSAVWLIVRCSVVSSGGGHEKTPHAGGVAVLSGLVRSARLGKQEPAGHAADATARHLGPGTARERVGQTRWRPRGTAAGCGRGRSAAATGAAPGRPGGPPRSTSSPERSTVAQSTSPRHSRVRVRRPASTVTRGGSPGSTSQTSTPSPVTTIHHRRAAGSTSGKHEGDDRAPVGHRLGVDVAVDVPQQQVRVQVLVAELGHPADAPPADGLDDRLELPAGLGEPVADPVALLAALDDAGPHQGVQPLGQQRR